MQHRVCLTLHHHAAQLRTGLAVSCSIASDNKCQVGGLKYVTRDFWETVNFTWDTIHEMGRGQNEGQIRMFPYDGGAGTDHIRLPAGPGWKPLRDMSHGLSRVN